MKTPPILSTAPLSGNLHSQLVRLLARRIVGGEYRPGESLPPEDELRDQFNVSRNALREAVKVLSSKKLLSVKTKTGTKVEPFENWSHTDPDVIAWRASYVGDVRFFREINEVRRFLEPAAAEYAADRATKAEKQEMRECYEEMLQFDPKKMDELTEEEHREFVRIDMRFHDSIFVGARNTIIQHMANALSSALYASRFVTHRVQGADADSIPLHGKVLDAIEAGDPEAARKRMRELMDVNERNINAVLG